jgi:hypothetical protein
MSESMYYNTDKIYVISLKRRQYRLTNFFNTIPSNIFDPKKIVIFDAVDGLQQKPPDWWAGGKGAYGCQLSHNKIWQEIIDNNYQNTIIFEDDAIFCENFTPQFLNFIGHLPEDWDQAYLGGQHLIKPTPINDYVVLGSNINRRHGYMIKNKMSAQKIVDCLSNPDLWTTHLINKMHGDHALGYMHKNKLIKAYASKPFLVGQNNDQFSDIGSNKSCQFKRWWNK